MSSCDALVPIESTLPSLVADVAVTTALALRLPSQCKEMVQEHRGISAKAWPKIEKGQPIPRSTAEMLVRRILQHHQPGAR